MASRTNVWAFVLGACKGDENRANAVFAVIFYDDGGIATVASMHDIPKVTLWDDVKRIRALLAEASSKRLIQLPRDAEAT